MPGALEEKKALEGLKWGKRGLRKSKWCQKGQFTKHNMN